MVGAVTDPRVPVENIGPHSSSGVGDHWVQRKYADDSSDLPIGSCREAELIIAEADPAQSVAIINDLRTRSIGLHSELDTSDWPLALYVDGGAAANAAAVIEERRRELFLQGVEMGDDQRTGNFADWDTGVSPVNAPIGDLTCLPLPENEFL